MIAYSTTFLLLLQIVFVNHAISGQSKLSDKNDDMITLPSGLKYKILIDSAAENIQVGDLIIVHVKYNNGVDSLNTYKRGTPVSILATKESNGSLEEGLSHLSKGDSAVFSVDNEALYKETFHLESLPAEVLKGKRTSIFIRVLDNLSAEKVKSVRETARRKKTQELISYLAKIKKDILDSSAAQFKIDDAIIKEYLKKNKLKASKTENGVYYIIIKEGKGAVATPGDSASIHYTGKLLDGTEFDKSTEGKPLVFQTGVGEVVPGFDEPLYYIKEGSKAIILIPSPFAYSVQGAKHEDKYIIPPNAVLRFDIDVLKYSKMK